MPPLPTTALDDLFSDDVDEIIERVLARYQPALSRVVMASFRSKLQLAITDNPDLKPWLPPSPFEPVHGAGALTAAQVALLGGSRPTRILHTVAFRLSLPLDGGDQQSLREAEQILHDADEALESLVEHHVVTPVEGPEAGLRRLRELIRLGVAAQIAAMLGALREHHDLARRRGSDDEPEIIRRYFLRALQVFSRIKLSGRDQEVFRDHYLDAGDIEELADERGHGLDAEVARRLGFLERFATAFEAGADALYGAGRREGDAPGALAGTEDAGQARARPARALSRATAPATRPRKR